MKQQEIHPEILAGMSDVRRPFGRRRCSSEDGVVDIRQIADIRADIPNCTFQMRTGCVHHYIIPECKAN
jgi:hypothetical protein